MAENGNGQTIQIVLNSELKEAQHLGFQALPAYLKQSSK